MKRNIEEIEEDNLESDVECKSNSMKDVELHSAFHYTGMTANHLVLKCGQVLFSKAVRRQSDEGLYREYIARNKETSEQFCTLCNHRAFETGNKLSNMIKHVKKCHCDVIILAFGDLPSSVVKDSIDIWNYASLNNEIPNTKSKVVPVTMKTQSKQRTLFDIPNSMRRYDFPSQQKLITECICLGLGPISFADNPGGAHLLKYFNNGVIPRGLGRHAITNNIVRLYDEHVEKSIVCLIKCYFE